MIRDNFLKILLIPLIGILIPLLSHVIDHGSYSLPGILLAYLYFIMVSYIIWLGGLHIHRYIRKNYHAIDNPYHKMIRLYAGNSVYAIIVFASFTLLWFSISNDRFSWPAFSEANLLNLLITNIITLVYEVLYLSKEREMDVKVVDELDKERIIAELEVLRNQLDPHFLFNSLNTLGQLIITAPDKANTFNHKLARVYRSYLINKNNDMVTLSEEIDLLNDYLFLIQIRYPGCLHITYNGIEGKENLYYLPPGALQCLAENAIKHNQLSTDDPLNISIFIDDSSLHITNDSKEKNEQTVNSKTGLKNLNARYMILCGKGIKTEKQAGSFTVKLPLLKNDSDEYYYH